MMADSDGGLRAGTLPSPSTAAPRGGGGEGRAATGKMAAAQAQRCLKMGARLGREGEAGGASAVTSRTGSAALDTGKGNSH